MSPSTLTMTTTTTTSTPPRPRPTRPLSLPLLHPTSPLIHPSESPTGLLNRWTGQYVSLASPTSTLPSPTVDDHSPLISTAVKASRTSADIVRVLDLELHSRTMASREPGNRHAGVHTPQASPDHAKGPHTPKRSPSTGSDASPLTRANMAKLRSETKTKTKRSVEAAPSLAIPTTSTRLGSPIHFDPPPKPSKRGTGATTATESSYGPVQSVAIDWDAGPARSDQYMFEGELLIRPPGTMSELSAYAPRPSAGRQHDSFLRMSDRAGSDTFHFPARPESLVDDVESSYAPSMAAPSSIARRVAKWTGGQQETVQEEAEPEEAAADLASPPSPLNTVPSKPSQAKSPRVSSVGNRVSLASGDTFGGRDKSAGATRFDTVAEETLDDLDRIRSELLGESPRAKRAPDHLASPRPHSLASSVIYSNASRQGHDGPESDEAITAHLLAAAAANERRIIPTEWQKPIGPAGKGFPPSAGTPLRGLQEEAYDSDDEPYSPASPRLMSKVDQILGRGAYEAGMSMEQERRILQEALVKSVMVTPPGGPTSLPPPPRHQHTHKPFASVSGMGSAALPISQDERSLRTIKRAGSIDSIPASIADSLTRLIPPTHPHDPKHSQSPSEMDTKRSAMLSDFDLTSKNDLSAEQRQVLLRRVRVLERRLGESLREDETGKWVVAPSTGIEYTGTIAGNHQRSQSSFQRLKAAFVREKDDFVLPMDIANEKVEPLRSRETELSLARTMSVDSAVTMSEDDMDRAHRRRQLVKLNKLLGAVVHPSHLEQGHVSMSPTALRLPAGSVESLNEFSPERPPLGSRRGSDPKDSWASKIRQTMGMRSNSSKDVGVIAPDQSFMDMGKETGWRKHKTSASSPAAGFSSLSLNEVDDKSFWNSPELSDAEKTQARKRAQKLNQVFGEAPPQSLYHRSRTTTPVPDSTIPLGSLEAINQSLQGLVYLAEHDQTKLDTIVDALAQDEEDTNTPSPGSQPSPPSPVHQNHSAPLSPPRPYRASTSSAFEVYTKPLSPDQSSSPSTPPRPSHAIDHTIFSPSLDDVPSPDLSLSQIYFDPMSHDARRRRTGKLSNFFGERIDFERPPLMHVPTTKKRGGGVGKKRSKKEVLDEVLGEMWRSVQFENRRGVLGGEEMDRFGAMIASLRRSQA